MAQQLKATTRDTSHRSIVNELRQNFKIPGVVYGRGFDSISVAIDYAEFTKILAEAGTSSIIDLVVDNGSKPVQVIISDLQRDPVKHRITHVDLHQVRMDEKIKTEVSLHFVGEAPAVKSLGANLIISKDKLTIECLPKDLPSEITVDISSLTEFDQAIHIKDLAVPMGVVILGDQADSIVSVLAPRAEEIPETPLETKEAELVEDKAKVSEADAGAEEPAAKK